MSSHEEFESPKTLSRNEQATKLREEFPECASFVDVMRAEFGDVKMLAMTEGGNHFERKTYRPDSDFTAVIDGETFLSLGRLIEGEKALAKWKAQNAKR